MILKSPQNTICLIDCSIQSATEMSVGMFYAEHQLEDIATVADSETGKRYRVQLPGSVAQNNTFSTGINQVLKFQKV